MNQDENRIIAKVNTINHYCPVKNGNWSLK